MKTFSQRKGLTPVVELIQVDGMNDALRTSLWNVLDLALWSSQDYLATNRGLPLIDGFSKALWFSHFKKPIDARPAYSHQILKQIRDYFFNCRWFSVYDFLEFTVAYHDRYAGLVNLLNEVLQREMSAYRLVSGHFTDITDAQELEMLEATLADSKFAAASAHLQQALDLYSRRENPDYRNSIKESISAVEAMARIVAGNPKATLGDALKELEKGGSLHPALKEGFSKLYGYTSDEGGIRHAMLEGEPRLDAADARYFLLSCTSFVNYLKAQIR